MTNKGVLPGLVLVVIFGCSNIYAADPSTSTMQLTCPYWEGRFDAAGFADEMNWGNSPYHPHGYHELLSGEWGAAIYYDGISTNPNAMWLTDYFLFPYWDTNSDELTYQWVWTIDNTTYDTNTANPTIELPIDQHTVTLIVNDGYTDSEPDQLTITVIEPIQATQLRIMPRTLNRTNRGRYVIAILQLPAGYTKAQVLDEKLLLCPDGDDGGIEASRQFVLRRNMDGTEQVTILALFDRGALTSAISKNGNTDLEVTGKLKTGQIFYGTDSINIIDPKNKPKPTRRSSRRRR